MGYPNRNLWIRGNQHQQQTTAETDYLRGSLRPIYLGLSQQLGSDANECAKRKKGQTRNGYKVTPATPGTTTNALVRNPKSSPFFRKQSYFFFDVFQVTKEKRTETSRKVTKDTLKEFIPVIVKKAAEESKPTKSTVSDHSQPGATAMRNSIDKEKNCDYELNVLGIPGGKREFTSNTEYEISQINSSAFNHLNVVVKIKHLFCIGNKKDGYQRPPTENTLHI